MFRSLTLAIPALFFAPPAHAQKSATGSLSGKVTVTHKGEAIDANVVVYLEPTGGAAKRTHRPARHESPKISQKGRRFRPKFTVVNTNTVVEFPNDDNRAHNVFSQKAKDKNRFDFGTYRRGTTKSKRFEKADTIEVRCNRHPDMAATILVLDEDYWVKTDRRGNWKLTGVPPGTYRLVAWVPFSARHKQDVVVAAGRETRLAPMVLKEGTLPPRTRRDGTPHPYYR